MAILPGLQANIRVNGQDMAEYPDPSKEKSESAATVYVQAESGQCFTVVWKADGDGPHTQKHIVASLRCDGRWARSQCSTPCPELMGGHFETIEAVRRNIDLKTTVTGKLAFSEIATSKK